ncbi:hypothetical protein HMPREF1861_02035 [Corynebacterium kroppenstedtii]|nr:hypothetical protein HMPREF1861_02035 [Corynebacterium kroppenstedtii]
MPQLCAPKGECGRGKGVFNPHNHVSESSHDTPTTASIIEAHHYVKHAAT